MIKFLALALLMAGAQSSHALTCSNDSGAKVDLQLRKKGQTFEGATHQATVDFGNNTWGAAADCSAIDSDLENVRYECSSEPEWNRFVVVALIDVAVDESSAVLHELRTDRRYSTGYRIEKSQTLSCEK